MPTVVIVWPATVEVGGSLSRRATITVTAPDQLGLLWAISRWFTDSEVDIEAIHATTHAGVARDTFMVTGDCFPDVLATTLSRSDAPRSRWRPAFV